MEGFRSYIICLILFLTLFHKSHSQQEYLNQTALNCSISPGISKGYLCDIGHLSSCNSIVTFRSRTPYNTAIDIAYLLGSEASKIASLNSISSLVDKIPVNKLIMVPVSCQCSGNIFQHFTPYTAINGSTYFMIATENYQSLTTCQALIAQNYYDPKNIPVGAGLIVPVRCACPSQNQTASGVVSLLTYTVQNGDTATSIGKMFGVSGQSILEANMLSKGSTFYAHTPILVPLTMESCSTHPEMFFCNCPNGHLGNGASGLTCISDDLGKRFPAKLVALLGVGIGFALLCLSLTGYKVYQYFNTRRIKIRKEGFFKQNGGLLLQEKVTYNGSHEKAKLFTEEELQRATDNYNQSRFLGQGGYGAVYKGMLPDGTIVAVKRSNAMDGNQIQQFINEVLILSQINHRNIVKLLGCCLETETPLLVYEYISNGTLLHHIQKKQHEPKISWENRLSIACDVAGALSYMHFSASMPIFHRDIKSSNILLDEKYNAKVSDFGTSRSVPEHKTHLSTAVQGTFGYFDPEYFQSSQFTDKSDVYSFGVTLVELLTGETPYSFAKDKDKNLVSTFLSLRNENSLSQILDPQVTKDAPKKDVEAMAELAMRCLRLSGKKRPTMKQVSMELEGLRERKSIAMDLVDEEEPEFSRDEEMYWCMNTASSYTIQDTIQDQSTDHISMVNI
ncbi:wall-associated receptor kinase-like 22 [Humulus lupulus]|uniref:wall-associated receptor kinase-like 22 n=1 Tax=Humulus lupulus TaxID=3486 RepID=UPI002B415451|nr:wall-associated receptor kinase-like 22 [Humulus lupulus]